MAVVDYDGGNVRGQRKVLVVNDELKIETAICDWCKQKTKWIGWDCISGCACTGRQIQRNFPDLAKELNLKEKEM